VKRVNQTPTERQKVSSLSHNEVTMRALLPTLAVLLAVGSAGRGSSPPPASSADAEAARTHNVVENAARLTIIGPTAVA
jgi:hypothetical protein